MRLRFEAHPNWAPIRNPPLLGRSWLPGFLYTTRSSLMIGCQVRCRCHCLMSSAARCHGDGEGGAEPKMGVCLRLLMPQRTSGHLKRSVPSGWNNLMQCHLRSEAGTVTRAKREVWVRSWPLIGWTRSWRCCCGHLQQQMCCS